MRFSDLVCILRLEFLLSCEMWFTTRIQMYVCNLQTKGVLSVLNEMQHSKVLNTICFCIGSQSILGIPLLGMKQKASP